MPADTQIILVCRTVGRTRLVDELIFAVTHDLAMDWMLPGVAPTGRRVEVPLVVVVEFDRDAIAGEHLLGPGVGHGAARIARCGEPAGRRGRERLEGPRPGWPSNALMRRDG